MQSEFEPVRSAAERAEAVFLEGWFILLVGLKTITSDEWGVTIEMEPLTDQGKAGPGSSKVSSAWSAFRFGSSGWHAQYVNWHLYLDPKVVEAVKSKLRELPANPSMAQRSELRQIIFDLAR